jgi:hypothetical protein
LTVGEVYQFTKELIVTVLRSIRHSQVLAHSARWRFKARSERNA